MSKKLIITEKPSVARDFARVLDVRGNHNGFIENDTYVISWCFGHLVEMSMPDEYDETYTHWRLEDLPFLPKTYRYQVVKSAKEQYEIVHNLLFREDIDTVYWAGDSGKEGQTIEENIRIYGGVRSGMQELRVWIDSQTDDEIRRGIREAKPMSDYALLGQSGIMRSIEDYSLGINFSRALSVRYGRLINNAAATKQYVPIAIGRVMTCVLGMVVKREREIRDFVETPFFRIIGSFSETAFDAEWKAVDGSKYFESPKLYKENGFKTKEDANAFIEFLNGKEAIVDLVELGTSKKKAPLLFNLAELQSECSKLFKISPNQTLEVVQELYERKLTTYPRTDARVLTTAVAKEITKNLKGIAGIPAFSGFVNEILSQKKYVGLEKTAYTDDKKVTDHYAIIPTGQTGGIDRLTSLQRSVYELIVRRFLSIFYPPAEYQTVKIQILVDTEHFFSSAKILSDPGYMKVSGIVQTKDGDEDQPKDQKGLLELARKLQKGDPVSVNEYSIKEGKTSPPKRYTSGNLILAMENAGNLIEDEELREQIKKSGIGTSATRGEILEKLVRNRYLNQNPKTQIISPENLGEMIYEVVRVNAPSLLNPEMTASWEMGLVGITNGTVDVKVYRAKLEDYIRRETTKMIENDLSSQIIPLIHPFTGKDAKGAASRKPLGIACPKCGGELTTTSFGYGCSNYWNQEAKCNFSVGTIAGVSLSEEDFKTLIEEKRTGVIDGFLSSSKKHFKAALILVNNDNNEPEVRFSFDDIQPETLEDVTCPACGGKIFLTGYGCTCENRNREEGSCYFSIGEIAGKSLSKEVLLKLLKEGKTDILAGFKGKKKNSFKARLVLTQNEAGQKTVGFDFSDIEPDTVPDVCCPDCGGKIMIRNGAYGCTSFRSDDPESCRFYIGKIAGKSLNVSQVKELLSTGQTQTIYGFKGKSGKKFDSCLKLQKNEAGKTEITFDFEHVKPKALNGVQCPICGGNIIKTQFGYGCDHYDKDHPETSCRFRIGSTLLGVKLTDSIIKSLLTDEATPVIQGFRSKSGKLFDAAIALRKEEDGTISGLRFVCETEDVTLPELKCPKCGAAMLQGHNGFRCSSYSPNEGGCDFYIGTIAGIKPDKEQVTKLLSEGKTDKISGFTGKSGKEFEASLVLTKQYKVVFDFSAEAMAESTLAQAEPLDDTNGQAIAGDDPTTPVSE